MAKKTAPVSQKRTPRLLWANAFCLMDTSSGASMSVRQMLHQLVKQGYDVQVLGATIFDNPKGASYLKQKAKGITAHSQKIVSVSDGDLTHDLLVTKNSYRNQMAAHEESLWLSQYSYILDTFKPDLVWFYGGQALDLLIADEARVRGIPSAFYLANGNYISSRWCRDIDLILTDSESTAAMYQKEVGIVPTPVGKFIDTAQFVAQTHQRERLLFVNPAFEKGASIIIQLALRLEKERPDITLEVVEARADWSAVLKETTARLGQPRNSMNNVVVTPNTTDMRPVYERARVLLAPSLWWESGARVLAEAMLNGIPAVVSHRGGSAGLIQNGGMVLEFPEACHEPPYKHLLSEEELQPLYDAVITLFDDEALYQEYVQKAYNVGKDRHHIDVSTQRLTRALAPLIAQKAGNKDFPRLQRRVHKHNLATQGADPELKVSLEARASEHEETSESEIRMEPENRKARFTTVRKPVSQTFTPPPAVRPDFSWQFNGQLITVDNRAKLIQKGVLEKLIDTQAFAVVAFDPASEVKEHDKYADNEDVQLFRHALLGDGEGATLYTCLEPALSSTLKPLPVEQVPPQHRQGTKVIAELPIQTIALDSIDGLPSLDWLILDERSDAITILEHGKKALQETLLIQARVAFQPTHERQPSLAELQHWASRNGFRFYRFNDASYQSLFPKESEAHEQLASELQSLDALFLPSHERMAQLDDNRKQKLVFLLHTVFDAHDMAYQVMSQVNELLAKNYLRFVEGELSAPVSQPQAPSKPAVQVKEKGVAPEKQPKKQTPDEIVANYLPDETLEQPGSIRWLIEKEKQFGGLQRGVVRNKTSKLDPRKPHQYSAGFIKKGDEFLPTHIGGDRMSMNYHGYSIAYSAFLLPLIERKRDQKLTIVEVGILRGTGLAIWCDLFPNARVIGLDLDPTIFEQHRPVLEELGAFQNNKPEVYHFDQFSDNRQKVRDIIGSNKIDLFIDDGAHTYEAIMKTLDAVKPKLADEFVYFVEDFKGIEKSIRMSLKASRSAYNDEMTVIVPKKSSYPVDFISREDFLQQARKNIAHIDEPCYLHQKPLREKSTYQIVKNLGELYEFSRKVLTNELNAIHGLEKSERFWEILLHYFLGQRFITRYLSRWNNGLLNNNPKAAAILDNFPRRTFRDYMNKTETLVGQASPYVVGNVIPIDAQDREVEGAESTDALKMKEVKIKQLLDSYEKGRCKIAYNLGVHNPKYWKANYKRDGIDFVDFPIFDTFVSNKIDWGIRHHLAKLDETKPADGYEGFWSSLALCLPTELLEDFMPLYEASERILENRNPEFVFSALLSTITSRLVAAVLAERGVPLYLHQHGGAYGEYPSHHAASFEKRISDLYFTWGWTGGNAVPEKPHRLIALKKEFYQFKRNPKEILIIAPHRSIVPEYTSGTDLDYYEEELIKEFYDSLSDEEKGLVVVRLRRQHGYSPEEERRMLSLFPGATVDAQQRSISQAYANAKEVVIVNPFTTPAWECEYLEIPYRVLNKPSEEFMQIPSFIPETYE